MARAGEAYKEEAAKPEVTPILLVRVLDIPLIADPLTKDSLYLTNSKTPVAFFDENDTAKTYNACALTYDQVKASTDNEISSVTLRLDNVGGAFTSLAKDYTIKGVRVQLLEAFADTLTSPAGARTLFEGHIEKANITISSIEIQVTADFSLSVKIPRRLYWVRDFPHLPSAKDPRTVSLK